MTSTALHDLGVAQLAAELRERRVSAVEAAQHFLARAQAHQNLGAYVAVNPDITLAQARAQDAAIAAGTAGPLAGVPIAHKDIFVTKGFPSTAGSKMLAGYQSPFDATVVTKLADAGAVERYRPGMATVRERYFAGLPADGARSIAAAVAPRS